MRARLGGFVILPRMLDKGRAEIAGTIGEYKYNCPLDQHFINFIGVDPIALREQLAKGKGDGEVLQWILANAKTPKTPLEIQQWSNYHDSRGPASVEQREYFQELHKQIAPHRDDVSGWADLLDLDDYVSFGGVV